MIDPEEVIRICAIDLDPDRIEPKKTIPINLGPKAPHVPVKIPPRKHRPIRESDELPTTKSSSLGEVIGDILDEIFE